MKKNLILMALFAAFCGTDAFAQYSGGKGTQADPFQIASAEDLQAVSDNPAACYVQTADIDLADVPFKSIATFTGTYDGQMYEIQNLAMESGANGLGLFSRVNTPGVLKNIVIRGASVSAGQWSGILCSTNGNWEKAGGLFKNCYVFDSAIDGQSCLGVFAGTSAGNFENCYAFNCTVEGNGDQIGGISGGNEGGGHYYDCMFYGDVSGNENTGGIVGFYNGDAKDALSTIKNCVVYGSLTVAKGGGGGLLGASNWNVGKFGILNSCSFAKVSGMGIGGIAGKDFHASSIDRIYCTGNIDAKGDVNSAGLLSNTPFNTSYAAVNGYNFGSVKASSPSKVGAVTGFFNGDNIKNFYFNKDCGVKGVAVGDDSGVKGLSTAEMKQMKSFSFTDNSVWQNIDGETTPFFANQTAPVKITECTTAKLKGTCTASLERLFVMGSYAGVIAESPVISNGTWKITIPEDVVSEDETVTIVAVDKDKMPSMAVKAKVVAVGSTGIGDININNTVNAEPKSWFNVAGQQLGPKQKGFNIVKFSDGKIVKMIK